MKNLKLLSLKQKTNIEAECFCHDNDGNVLFISSGKMYCLHNDSNALSVCEGFSLENDESNTLIGMEYIGDGELFLASCFGELHIFDLYEKEVTKYLDLGIKIETFSWSPDHLVFVLLTGDSLILMTRTFYKITEKSLYPDEFGESKPINVGWGSKETQFHGSEGKDAAKVKKIEPKRALAYDDGHPRISWRSQEDKYYFVTSSLHPNKGFRQIRIWSKDGVLQSTSEVKDGLEEPVAWRPGGNIACSQQDANKHKIIFFERNGLQHGEFTLPFRPNTYRVKDLLWNTDGSILLLAAEEIEKPSFYQIMLWTCGNYHWYLKQHFSLQNFDPKKSLLMKWSSLQPYALYILNQSTQDFFQVNWTFSISCATSKSEDAIVASIDNDNLLVTPFLQMTVPPPMCAYSYTLPYPIQCVCFSTESPKFCCYMGNFKLAFFQKAEIQEEYQLSDQCKMKLVAAGGNGFKAKVQPYSFLGIFNLNLKGIEAFGFSLSHWTWTNENRLFCVCSYQENGIPYFALILFDISSKLIPGQEICGSCISSLKYSVAGICTNTSGSVVAVQFTNGQVMKLNISETSNMSEESLVPWLCDDGSHLILPEPCVTMSVMSICKKDYFLGLSDSAILYCNKTAILPKCTSYYIHDEYLLATTKDHILKFFLIDWDLSDLKKLHLDSNVQLQKIENNAKIIIAPHNSTKVILQMPRGNLETVHPRPLVLSQACKHLDNLHFDKAFELSKVHRIDLNILYDHNPKVFLDNVNLVVDQLKSSTNLNLFLASLRNEDICETLYSLAYKGKIRPDKLNLEHHKIDVICNSVREVIEAKNDNRLFLTYIATYAKKTEPELEEALILLKGMKDSDPKGNQLLIDSALNFLLYLVDVNELIDVALGTYDLEITVMVAQKSQKDPKEFLPFYNELKSLEENYRKYKIDMHLRRFKKALQHISKCEEHFDECLFLIRDQRLYIDSLYLFPPSSIRCKIVWKEYGNYLIDKRYYDEAGLVYSRCEDYEKALMAYKESLNWQSMLCAAIQLSYSDDKIVALCIETADKLKSSQKFLEASYLLEQYVKDVEESIVTLIEGCEWNAALLMMSKYRRQDISDSSLKPALLEHYSYLESYIAQLSKDFNIHNERLKVVRIQKQKDAEFASMIKLYDEELFDDGDSIADGTSVATSCAESKQLSGSIMTRKSSKSRRKQKLKKYRLKEGSPDEDLAHIAALSEIIMKIDNLKDNFLNTLKTMVHFGYDEKVKYLQQEMCKLVTMVDTEIPEIWKPSENSQDSEMRFGPDSTANSIAAKLQSEKKNPINYRSDPELAQPPWRKIDISLQMFK